ncbi:MAG TPA: YbaK/EbsC family protein [Melioribacteraceae bacterium]|nr:YbaK/EbsC family protein [Melioribacteraceae bacterium]
MPSKKLKEFLDQNKIKYVTIKHSVAFTAQEIAASAHIKGRELAKTVLIKINGRMAMCVLPASYKVDFNLLKQAVENDNVRLANEMEFKDKFPECDVGAMPPFGNLYNMDVYVAQSLLDDDEIAFNAGTHTELIQMSLKDFLDLVKPKIIKFSFPTKL